MPDIPATAEITSLFDKLIPIAFQLGLVAMLGMGLVLLLMGQRMVRSACTFAGLVIGGLVAFIICQQTTSGSTMMLWTMGGAVIGAISTVFMYRIWMGVVLMLMLGLAVPSAVLVWQGEVGAITCDEFTAAMSQNDVSVESSMDGNVIEKINNAIRHIYESQRQFITNWYQGLGKAGRMMVSTCGFIGGLAGLVFGLASPKRAACVVAAFTGSIMVAIAGNGLIAGTSSKYAQWLNNSPRTFIVLIGLITILGVIWQWTIFARKADK